MSMLDRGQIESTLLIVALAASVAGCAHDDRPFATTAPAGTAAAATKATDDFKCTQVMDVSVTSDWFNAGFENSLDNTRWQVK